MFLRSCDASVEMFVRAENDGERKTLMIKRFFGGGICVTVTSTSFQMSQFSVTQAYC